MLRLPYIAYANIVNLDSSSGGDLHKALVPPEQVDDFIIIRARGFTSKVRLMMTREILKDVGLPILEWQLLFSVARFGSCHLAYITRRTSIDPAHGSRAVSALEKKGLISRCDDPENRRRKLISLTDEGVAMFEHVWPRAQRNMRRITDKLTAEEFNELKRLLDLLGSATNSVVMEQDTHERNSANAKEDGSLAAQ